jgi:methyl-accepting chemotaxis protein
VVGGIIEVANLLEETSRTATNQSTSLSSVNVTIADIDRMTQANTALVEQTSAATRTVADQTASIVSAAGRFTFEDAPTGARAAQRKLENVWAQTS